jgi:hypothetical protein
MSRSDTPALPITRTAPRTQRKNARKSARTRFRDHQAKAELKLWLSIVKLDNISASMAVISTARPFEKMYETQARAWHGVFHALPSAIFRWTALKCRQGVACPARGSGGNIFLLSLAWTARRNLIDQRGFNCLGAARQNGQAEQISRSNPLSSGKCRLE